MPESFVLKTIDRLVKPSEWYHFSAVIINGYTLIATKEDQTNAGLVMIAKKPGPKKRTFGMNPFSPYRDYYGEFLLQTKLLPQVLKVKFAIGYTINSRVVTVDDYSNFGWLRLATGLEDIIYPNLSDQKQLLDYLRQQSKQPQFVVTRIYHYLQTDLYHYLTTAIFEAKAT